MIMKKVTILTVALTVLMMLVAVMPALAQPTEKKIPFYAIQIPNVPPPTQPPEYSVFVTEGDTFHARNQVGAGKLWISPNAPPSAPSGTTSSIIIININLKTGEGDIKFEMTWTIGAGTYEGNIIGKLVGPPYASSSAQYNMYLHGVLHGTGVFEGQKIQLEGIRLVGQPFVWTGTILTP